MHRIRSIFSRFESGILMILLHQERIQCLQHVNKRDIVRVYNIGNVVFGNNWMPSAKSQLTYKRHIEMLSVKDRVCDMKTVNRVASCFMQSISWTPFLQWLPYQRTDLAPEEHSYDGTDTKIRWKTMFKRRVADFLFPLLIKHCHEFAQHCSRMRLTNDLYKHSLACVSSTLFLWQYYRLQPVSAPSWSKVNVQTKDPFSTEFATC